MVVASGGGGALAVLEETPQALVRIQTRRLMTTATQVMEIAAALGTATKTQMTAKDQNHHPKQLARRSLEEKKQFPLILRQYRLCR